jgi:basic membrane lipoprotein Med (substrate-binding protein (PBP1-ABC) superfamily)
MSLRPSSARLAAAAALALAAAADCSLAVEDEVTGTGIGTLCAANADCHAGVCDAGLCTAPCVADSECPAPSRCFAGKCALPLHVSALWEGVVTGGEGWNSSHQDGMNDAAKSLPYLVWDYREEVVADVPGKVSAAIDEAAAAGARVVIANSYNHQDEVMERADAHPDVVFLIAGGTVANGRNVNSYYAHLEQSLYIAGKVAALKTTTRRLGIISGLVTPEQVRDTNAFILGARSIDPAIVVEVTWIGFWNDYQTEPSYTFEGRRLFREELLAARLIASGCDVIMSQSDNQRAVRYVEALVKGGRKGLWSIAENNRFGFREITPTGPDGPPMASALGAAYYNWGPLYVRLFEQIYRRTWDPNELLYDPVTAGPDTVVGFELNPTVGIDDTAVKKYQLDQANSGFESVFRGPYSVTGQRDADGDGVADPVQAVAPGETLTDDEFNRMCWLAEGAIEKVDPLDPASADRPARVPDGDVEPAPDLLGPPGAEPGTFLKCSENI